MRIHLINLVLLSHYFFDGCNDNTSSEYSKSKIKQQGSRAAGFDIPYSGDYERLVRKDGMKSFRLRVDSKQPERLHHDSSYRI
jgi:hypothetical protein